MLSIRGITELCNTIFVGNLLLGNYQYIDTRALNNKSCFFMWPCQVWVYCLGETRFERQSPLCL